MVVVVVAFAPLVVGVGSGWVVGGGGAVVGGGGGAVVGGGGGGGGGGAEAFTVKVA